MYYIVEIQKYAGGDFGHLVHYADTRAKAESKYYEVLAAAAVSELPQHSACLINDEGQHVMSKCYKRTVVQTPAPAPEPEEETAGE